MFPLPLVIDGVIKDDNLKLIKKSTRWLTNALNNKNVLLKDVFYAFYKDSEIYIIKKELK